MGGSNASLFPIYLDNWLFYELLADSNCYLLSSLPYELVTGIPYDTYVEQTDKHNIHGWWEWENNTVRVIELPSAFHGSCVSAIAYEINRTFDGVRSTNAGILGLGTTTTKSRGSGKEADASFRPKAKPRVKRGGCDTSGTRPWPNIVVEVAYKQSEMDVRNKVENYWLKSGRAHDVIVIKIEELIAPATRPSVMTAWHYCISNLTDTGAFDPTMYEFGTVDRQGNQISPQIGENVIYIRLNCLYFGMPSNFVIPSSLPNPILIDLYHVQFAILNCD